MCACIVWLLSEVNLSDHKRAWLAAALLAGLAFVLYPAAWHQAVGHGDAWLRERASNDAWNAWLAKTSKPGFEATLESVAIEPFPIPTTAHLWWIAEVRFFVTFGLLAWYAARRWWQGDPLW